MFVIVMYQRNKSLTRGEIDAYWKSKKKTEEEHLGELSGSKSNTQVIYLSRKLIDLRSSSLKSIRVVLLTGELLRRVKRKDAEV